MPARRANKPLVETICPARSAISRREPRQASCLRPRKIQSPREIQSPRKIQVLRKSKSSENPSPQKIQSSQALEYLKRPSCRRRTDRRRHPRSWQDLPPRLFLPPTLAPLSAHPANRNAAWRPGERRLRRRVFRSPPC